MSHLEEARRMASGFSAELRRVRIERGVTTRELAAATNVRQDVINRIETGRWLPTVEEESALTEWLMHHPL